MRFAAALIVVASACAGPAGGGGSAGIARSLADASSHDDAAAAYDLLSTPVKQRVTLEQFTARWKEAKVERARQAAALAQAVAAGATVGERARLHVDESQVATLVREGDGWRLETPLLLAGGPRTPEEAIRRFAEALDERSFGTAVRLLTAERQEGVREALDSFVDGLRAHVGESIEVANDRATLVWTDGQRRWRVVLKREQGAWRIDDFSQQ